MKRAFIIVGVALLMGCATGPPRRPYLVHHPELDPYTAECIRERKVHIGMTKEQVKASWGPPYKVNRTVTAYGTREQWVYRGFTSGYVYFDDGVVTAIQN